MSEKEAVVVTQALLRILGADKDGTLSTARVDTVEHSYCPRMRYPHAHKVEDSKKLSVVERPTVFVLEMSCAFSDRCLKACKLWWDVGQEAGVAGLRARLRGSTIIESPQPQ